jgi:hypothetical protein
MLLTFDLKKPLITRISLIEARLREWLKSLEGCIMQPKFPFGFWLLTFNF